MKKIMLKIKFSKLRVEPAPGLARALYPPPVYYRLHRSPPLLSCCGFFRINGDGPILFNELLNNAVHGRPSRVVQLQLLNDHFSQVEVDGGTLGLRPPTPGGRDRVATVNATTFTQCNRIFSFHT